MLFDRLIKLMSLIFFLSAVWLIKKEINFVGAKNLLNIILSVPFTALIIGFFLTGVNYLILSCYDVLGLKYIHKKLPYQKILPMSAVSFAVSNLAGHIYASGGAVRYLFLNPLGFSKKNIFLLVFFETLSIVLGLALGFILAVFLETVNGTLKNYHYLSLFYLSAFLIIAGFLFYFEEIVKKRRSFKIGKTIVKAPDTKLTAQQIWVGLFDFISMFLVFYVFLRTFISADIITVFIIFTTATVLSYLSQVPAGIGVLESLFLLLFTHTGAEKGAILGAFALYRSVYFFIPFIIGCCVFLVLKKKK